MKDLYFENYDTQERYWSWYWIRRMIVKMSILPKAIYRFNAIPIKISMAFSIELETIVAKIFMELQKAPNSQSILEKEEERSQISNCTIKLE